MRNVPDKFVEKIKTHFLYFLTIFFPRKSCRLLGNMEDYGRPQTTIWHMLSSCWMSKSTDTHSDYVIKGKAIPLQTWSGAGGSRKLKFPDFITTAQDGGKVVSLTSRECFWYSFLLEGERLQDHSAIGRILCQIKTPLTPAGIEPATFRFVAQHLNHCVTAVPQIM